jgi:hypothetical protein
MLVPVYELVPINTYLTYDISSIDLLLQSNVEHFIFCDLILSHADPHLTEYSVVLRISLHAVPHTTFRYPRLVLRHIQSRGIVQLQLKTWKDHADDLKVVSEINTRLSYYSNLQLLERLKAVLHPAMPIPQIHLRGRRIDFAHE